LQRGRAAVPALLFRVVQGASGHGAAGVSPTKAYHGPCGLLLKSPKTLSARVGSVVFEVVGRAALGEAESQLAVVLRDSDMIHARRANEQEGN
jgi:hypothetical protein